MLTDFLLPFESFATITRGPFCDQQIMADAELEYSGQHFYVELDTGSVSHKRQKRRWSKCYRNVSDFLLVITSSETRMNNLIRNASAVSSIALFTTYAQAQTEPFGEIWVDCQGVSAAVPRPENSEC